MSLQLAQANAFHLAKSLLVCVVLIRTDGGYGVMPASDFDGPAEAVLFEFDPFG